MDPDSEFTFPALSPYHTPAGQLALNRAFQQVVTHNPLHQLLQGLWCQKTIEKKAAKNVCGNSALAGPVGLALFPACPSCVRLLKCSPLLPCFVDIPQTA